MKNKLKTSLLFSLLGISLLGTLGVAFGATYALFETRNEVMNKEAPLTIGSQGNRDTELKIKVVLSNSDWYQESGNIEINFFNSTSSANKKIYYYKTQNAGTIETSIDYFKTSYTDVDVSRTNPNNAYILWNKTEAISIANQYSSNIGKTLVLTIGEHYSDAVHIYDNAGSNYYYYALTVSWE